MMFSQLSMVLAATTVSAATSQHRGSHKPFETLVTFGDSFTDNGRLGFYFGSGGKGPAPGQYHTETDVTASGGLTWAQYAARETGSRLVDYAVGGATCSDDIVARYLDPIGRTFPSVLEDQIPSFKSDVPFKSMYPNRNAENTVYALWIGTNDLGAAGAFLTDSQAPGKTITDFVDCVWSIFDHIYKTGGRRFVLINEAPLELAPLYATPENGGTLDSQFWGNKSQYDIPAYTEKIKQYTTNVNTIFDYGVPFHLKVKSRWPKAKFDIFDVHSLMKDIHARPTEYLDAPYNTTGYYRHCQATNNADCVDQTELGPLSGFMWFDELHPSNKTGEFRCHKFSNAILRLT